MKKKFQRTKFRAYSKLGKGRKKKQKYRKAKGRHSKIREKHKGRPRRVEIGYKKNDAERGLIESKKPVLVSNIKSLKEIKKGEIAVLTRVGKKRKMEIADYAQENNLIIKNFNVKKFLKKIERKKKYEEKLKHEKTKEKKQKEEVDKEPVEGKNEEKNKTKIEGEK